MMNDATENKRLESLLKAVRTLANSITEDPVSAPDGCYCNPGECTDEDPSCLERAARVAIDEIKKAFEFEVRSTTPGRLSNFPEFVFVDEWDKQNKREPGINYGIRTLEFLGAMQGETHRIITQREADIATAVLQWLGTNCGGAFLATCERRIRDARDSQSITWDAQRRRYVREGANAKPDRIAVEAERIAVQYINSASKTDKGANASFLSLAEDIEAAMRAVIESER